MNDFGYGRWPRSSDDVIPTHGGAMNTHAESRLPLQGLLVIQILIGYEWLMSGLTKLARGGFPSGLTAELEEKSQGRQRGTQASRRCRGPQRQRLWLSDRDR